MRTIHKGLLLVAVPLIFQILFLAAVWYWSFQVYDRIDQLNKCHEVLKHVSRIEESIKNSAIEMAAHSVRADSESHFRGMVEARKTYSVTDDFRELRKLRANDPADLKDLKEFEQALRDLNAIIAETKAQIDGRKRIGDRDKVMAFLHVEEKVNILTRYTKDFIARQRVFSEETGKELRDLQSQLTIVLLTFFLLNVFLAVQGAWYFASSIQRRVKSVADNAILFAAGRSLTEPLDGADEIADMDRSFRLMARTVEEAREKEQAIFSNAVDIVCTMDDTGRITQANPALLEALDMPEDDVLSRHFLDCVPDECKAIATEFLKLASQSQDDAYRAEIAVQSKSGVKRDFLWSVKYNDDYKTYYCVASDITDRKALEQMKQEFIAMVSHDLRSPLTALLATYDLLTAGAFGTLNEKGVTRIDTAKLSLRRLINMINDLLDLDKLESGSIEIDCKIVSADKIMNLTAESLRGMAEQNDVQLNVKTSDLHLMADEDRLMQVLTNLVSNAIKFSPSDRSVTLYCHDLEHCCEFRVDDCGRGIPADMQEQVFDRFKQISPEDRKKNKGSGLGLAISKAIVEAHGGTIGVTSTVGEGSSFWFRIPDPPESAKN